MNDANSQPLWSALRWLSQYAFFPTSRLKGGAELLVLVAECAQSEERKEGHARFSMQLGDGAKNAALRAHAMRRSLAHYKCDNSAKV